MALIQNLLSKLNWVTLPSVKPTLADLIERESVIGGTVFGATPAGMTRRFFMEDENEWFFTETAVDASGYKRTYTIRYQVLPAGVLKSVDGREHQFVEGIELDNLLKATELYKRRIDQQLYHPQAV